MEGSCDGSKGFDDKMQEIVEGSCHVEHEDMQEAEDSSSGTSERGGVTRWDGRADTVFHWISNLSGLLSQSDAEFEAALDANVSEQPLQSVIQSFKEKEKSRAMCGRIWGKGYVAYRCKDCGKGVCSAICHECFFAGPHKDHDYVMYRSAAGGCCDCGDEGVWKPEGNCKHHHGDIKRTPPSLPDEEAARALVLLRGILWIAVHTLQQHSENSFGKALLSWCAGFSSKTDSFRWLMGDALLVDRSNRVLDLFSNAPSLKCELQALDQLALQLFNVDSMDSLMSIPLALDISSNQEMDVDFDEVHNFIAQHPKLSAVDPSLSLLRMLSKVAMPLHNSASNTILASLYHPQAKAIFTLVFIQEYCSFLHHVLCAEDHSHISSRVVDVSVQLFSNESITVAAIEEYGFFHVLLLSLKAIVRRAKPTTISHSSNTGGRILPGKIDPSHALLSQRRNWPVISDFLNVLSGRLAPWLFMKNPELRNIWFQFESDFQDSDLQTWQTKAHIAREPKDWSAGLYFEWELIAEGTTSLQKAFQVPEDTSAATNVIQSIIQDILQDGSWRNPLYPGAQNPVHKSEAEEASSVRFSDSVFDMEKSVIRGKVPDDSQTIASDMTEIPSTAFNAPINFSSGPHSHVFDFPVWDGMSSDHPTLGTLYAVSNCEHFPISFHLPLHRAISQLLLTLVKRQGCVEFSSILGNQASCVFAHLIESPLRLISAVCQIRSLMWRRNGNAAYRRAWFYRSPYLSEHCFDSDTFLIHCASHVVNSDGLWTRIFNAFGLQNASTILYEETAKAHPLQDSLPRVNSLWAISDFTEHGRNMFSGALGAAVQTVVGNWRILHDEETRVKQEIVSCLSTEDLPYSRIMDSMPTRLHENPSFSKWLKDVAEFIPPSIDGSKSGLYQLRKEAWAQHFNGLLLTCRSIHADAIETAVERWALAIKGANSVWFFPNPSSPENKSIANLNVAARSMLQCSAFWQTVHAVLCTAVYAVAIPAAFQTHIIISCVLTALSISQTNQEKNQCLDNFKTQLPIQQQAWEGNYTPADQVDSLPGTSRSIQELFHMLATAEKDRIPGLQAAAKYAIHYYMETDKALHSEENAGSSSSANQNMEPVAPASPLLSSSPGLSPIRSKAKAQAAKAAALAKMRAAALRADSMILDECHGDSSMNEAHIDGSMQQEIPNSGPVQDSLFECAICRGEQQPDTDDPLCILMNLKPDVSRCIRWQSTFGKRGFKAGDSGTLGFAGVIPHSCGHVCHHSCLLDSSAMGETGLTCPVCRATDVVALPLYPLSSVTRSSPDADLQALVPMTDSLLEHVRLKSLGSNSNMPDATALFSLWESACFEMLKTLKEGNRVHDRQWLLARVLGRMVIGMGRQDQMVNFFRDFCASVRCIRSSILFGPCFELIRLVTLAHAEEYTKSSDADGSESAAQGSSVHPMCPTQWFRMERDKWIMLLQERLGNMLHISSQATESVQTDVRMFIGQWETEMNTLSELLFMASKSSPLDPESPCTLDSLVQFRSQLGECGSEDSAMGFNLEDKPSKNGLCESGQSSQSSYSSVSSIPMQDLLLYWSMKTTMTTSAPNLINLPPTYQELYWQYHNQPCSQCSKSQSDANLCLLCGSLSCDDCFILHCRMCSGSFGLFIQLTSTSILVVHRRHKAAWGSIYLDPHGEEDVLLRRGMSLSLHAGRYAHLQKHFASGALFEDKKLANSWDPA